VRRHLAALAALWLVLATAQAAPVFELDDAGLSPAQRDATRQLLDQAVVRLPVAWREALDRPIAVRWRVDLPDGVHGRATRWAIALDRKLLDGIEAPGGSADQRASAAAAALTATLHELAHLYDRTPRGRLSRDPRLLDLAGWQVAALGPGRRGRNDLRDRSPDAYELASPREFVAVNLEHYLLDPAYRCRRPALAAHFDAHFGHPPPPPGGACAEGLAFVQDDPGSADPLSVIDPERIYAVDYLLAEPNAQPMSRWGHSMLRLVVCAPGRTPGPECRLDLQHHLVLSFRAFVDDVQISSWRGLTGDYPSRLFVLPLGQVVDEYTKVELRDLSSTPLALSRSEIAALVERAAQLHWGYDGRYLFISNNCAVETFRLLHDGVPRLAGRALAGITPTGLLRRLRANGVLDEAATPEDRDLAARQGYYFAAADAHYDALFAIARAELALDVADAQAWLAAAPTTRAEALRRAGLRDGAALLVLESAALRREQALAQDELKRRWLGRSGLAAASGRDDVASALQEYLRLGGAFSRPAAWLDGIEGYGLPQQAEREALRARAVQDATRRRAHAAALEDGVMALLSPQRRERVAATRANIVLIGERVRVLAGDHAGP